MQQKIAKFKETLRKAKAYQHALGVMYYDFQTVMPRAGADGYASTVGTLSEEVYKLNTSQEFKDLTAELCARGDELDPVTRREAEVLQEEIARMDCVPVQEYVDYQTAQSLASSVWHQAKVDNDYAAFRPHLKTLLDYSRRFALYYAPDRAPYDTLLDQYEKGLTMQTLDGYFASLRKSLQPLVEKTAARKDRIDDSFLFRHYPVEGQRKLSDEVMRIMGLDRARCAIGEVEHPFTIDFSKNDVRITTHYYEDAVASSLYSVIHEGGHALYGLNIGDELQGSPLADGASMSIHESQSRLYENIIGRSKGFTALLFSKMQALFPEQLAGVTAHDFYRAVNKSVPSLIRTEADELTYSFHIMVRYELEKRLVEGSLTVDDLPAEWNRLYHELLGVEVPDDTHGVLQDSHWSGGSFGYFPSYSLGSAYGAQFVDVMRRELDVDALVAAGELAPITDWLARNIHRHGLMKTPAQLIQETCGAPFDPRYYVEYLTRKYTEIYEL